MSDVAVEVRWAEDQRFEANGKNGASQVVDGRAEVAPSPMEGLLISLAACMGVDVVEILKKSRVPLDGLVVRAEGDRHPEPPRRYTAVRLIYEVSGVPEGERSKLQRAVDLSRDRYCSVLHTLHPDLALSIRVEAG
ncbi:MAG: OsmC family protein [Gemmatimonadota bacterium]